jgi:hypothetical protein
VNQLQELLHELKRQKDANVILGETVTRAKQSIKNVKATNQGVVLTGFINAPEQASKTDQDISNIEADNKGFVIAGTANNIDISSLRTW